MSRLLVLTWGSAELEAPDWAEPPRSLLENADPGELARLAAARAVLWLPAGAALGRPEWEGIRCWLGAAGTGSPRTAEARTRLVGDGYDLAGGRVLLLSSAGAVVPWRGRLARAPGAALQRLPFVLRVTVPATLSQHLRELNRRTSAAARLLAGEADRPSLAALLAPWAPALVRALRGRGAWRARMARAVLEAYGDVLREAKIYERGLAPLGPPPGEPS